MAKRKGKKNVKQVESSPGGTINDVDVKEVKIDKEDEIRDQVEAQRQSAAIRAIRDIEIERMLTGLRLFRSYCNEEQLQTPLLQFFETNLPNLSLIRKEENGQFEVQWKGSKYSLNDDNEINSNLFGANDLQSGNIIMEEPSFTGMRGMQDAFQTPGATSQRMSIGMTPKTLRLPKNGEMILSVHGSPLGVFKEDHAMEAINESS